MATSPLDSKCEGRERESEFVQIDERTDTSAEKQRAAAAAAAAVTGTHV